MVITLQGRVFTIARCRPMRMALSSVHSMYQLYHLADRREAAGLAHTSKLAALADSITGH